MRKNLGAKPFTYPQPVFIIAAYDENGLPNAMNAAWGGISEMNEISICISEGHKTTANILKRKAFTVSMAEAGQIIACDYVALFRATRFRTIRPCGIPCHPVGICGCPAD